MNEIHLSLQATLDLEEIENYISQDNPDAAARLLQKIIKKCELLAVHPEIGFDRSELNPDLRSFPVGNYSIFYCPLDAGIKVVRVLHSSRDVPKLFELD